MFDTVIVHISLVTVQSNLMLAASEFGVSTAVCATADASKDANWWLHVLDCVLDESIAQ